MSGNTVRHVLLRSHTTKKGQQIKLLSLQGRDDVTRTRDPFVPNEVRYQLRYIPKMLFLTFCYLRSQRIPDVFVF